MKVDVKTLTIDNAAGVALLSGQLGYDNSPIQARERIAAIAVSDVDEAWGAFINDLLVGWIHVFYTCRLETDPFCEIGGLVVNEGHRGLGIGLLLVNKSLTWAKEKSCNSISVRSNVLRSAAHAFYGRLGFVEKKEQKVFELLT